MSGKDIRDSVGLLLVVASMVFVGMEVRDSRAAVEAEIADGIADGFIETNMAVIEDPSLGCVLVVGLYRPEALSDQQVIRFAMYIRALFNQYFRVFDLYQTGLMSEDMWQFIANQAAWFADTDGGRQFFEANPGSPQAFWDAVGVHAGTLPGPDFGMGRPVPEGCLL